MSNLKIIFERELLFLLLIPAVILILWSYFKVAKRYRCTRNRITSLILFMLIMLLSVSVLSGTTFAYTTPNNSNEIILLVDVSLSGKSWGGEVPAEQISVEQRRNEFVKSVLDDGDSQFRMGIVTFARSPVYAAKLSNDTDEVYRQYINSTAEYPPDPDDSATDIAAALNYVIEKKLFTEPSAGKIVIISDGVQTDGDAVSAIMAVAAKGVKVVAVQISDYVNYEEAMITGIDFPDSKIIEGETVKLTVNIQSSVSAEATLRMFDNGKETLTRDISLVESTKLPMKEEVEYSFSESWHEISFVLEMADGDSLTQNNVCHAYVFLDIFDSVLILQLTNEADVLAPILLEEGFSSVTVKNIAEAPDTMKELRNYSQVILMNIANGDLPQGFGELLSEYVTQFGGGLLTVGGDEDVFDEDGTPVLDAQGNVKKTAHAYNRTDMNAGSTAYRDLLPVNCIQYVPPIALFFAIDASSSMDQKDSTGKSKMDSAKLGAKACLAGLDDRDWVGIISFSTTAKLEIKLTPVSQADLIISAIDRIATVSQTNFAPPIQMAGQYLSTFKNAEKKHIIFITDGAPNKQNLHQEWIEYYYSESKITLSAVLIGRDTDAESVVKNMASIGHGEAYLSDGNKLSEDIRRDLSRKEILEYEPKKFNPTVKSFTEELKGIEVTSENPFPSLGGFYGTKLKKDAQDILVDQYGTPVYARWKRGEGRVGSFLSNLSGDWAGDFFADADGRGVRFIVNALKYLAPTKDIREEDLEISVKNDNYTAYLTVKPTLPLSENQQLQVTVYRPNKAGGAKIADKPFLLNKFYEGSFIYEESGIYDVTVAVVDLYGNIVGDINPSTIKLSFSYSKEYAVFFDAAEANRLLNDIAVSGGGTVVTETDYKEIYQQFPMENQRKFDPTVLFIILAISLFLLDIAVRKFKWKWPHEIIRDRKTKKNLKRGLVKTREGYNASI